MIRSIIIAIIVATTSANAIAASVDKIQCMPGIDYVVVVETTTGTVLKHCIDTKTSSGAAAP